MKRTCASIDIGTHTARLLIASEIGAGRFKPLIRKRQYIRLAEHFDYSGKKVIPPECVERTVNVLKNFLIDINRSHAQDVYAIATGFVRDAENRDEFIERIYSETGIHADVVKGDKEAFLTAKGVLHTLGIQSRPLLIFDLGGGSTEFFFASRNRQVVRSVPLGSMVLTKRFLKSDPPEDNHIHSLSEYIDRSLTRLIPEFFSHNDSLSVVGTGGSVITLAMMLNEIEPEEILVEMINGLTLQAEEIDSLFNRMKKINLAQRLSMTGLDEGRAGIILAGTFVILKILQYSGANQLTVSMSDLLEGVLIEHVEGEVYEQ